MYKGSVDTDDCNIETKEVDDGVTLDIDPKGCLMKVNHIKRINNKTLHFINKNPEV